MDYQLKAVYTIGFLNFVLEKDSESYRHEVVLYDKVTKCQFYDKLAYYYFELPKFTKTEDELENIQDKWMYAIKNLSALNDKPVVLKEQVFTRLFRIAEIAKFSEKEKFAYQGSLKKCGTIAPYWKKVIPMVAMTEKPKERLKEKLKKDFLLQKT